MQNKLIEDDRFIQRFYKTRYGFSLLSHFIQFIPRNTEKLKGGTRKGDIPIILNQSSEDEHLLTLTQRISQHISASWLW